MINGTDWNQIGIFIALVYISMMLTLILNKIK
jgi:hypothetical protein